jgi:hypothetical protein
MTLNIIGIEEDPTLPSDQFWTAAADLLIQIASVQPKMGQAIDAVIDDGGDRLAEHGRRHGLLLPGVGEHVHVQGDPAIPPTTDHRRSRRRRGTEPHARDRRARPNRQ